jgi:hypothetical protein
MMYILLGSLFWPFEFHILHIQYLSKCPSRAKMYNSESMEVLSLQCNGLCQFLDSTAPLMGINDLWAMTPC